MDYPPARCMLTVILESKNEQLVIESSEKLTEKLKNNYSGQNGFRRIVGPADAPLYKANDYFRRMVSVKSGDYGMLVSVKNSVEEWLENNCSNLKPGELKADFVFN